MKSVKLDGNEVVRIIDVERPQPGAGQVLVRTVLSVLCGSELHGWRGPGQEIGNSGHEAAGIVAEVGEGVTSVAPGDRVGAAAVAGCGRCEHCAQGRDTWCENRTVHGSMHAEYFVIPERACRKLPDDISWEAGVLISGDGFGVPYHSAGKFEGGAVETVAVFGLGPIGLGSVLLQHWLGRRVIGVDVRPFRLAHARRLGADTVIDARTEDSVKAIREWTNGRGVDVAIEAAGRPETAGQCFRVVRNGGLVVFNGEQPAIELSPSEDFIRRDVHAVGSWYYFRCEYPQMVDFVRRGLPVTDLISHRFNATDAAEAFGSFAAGETAKTALVWMQPDEVAS